MAYQPGVYNTFFLEDYPQESQLIFKLQQRKLSKVKPLAENVVSQLNPDWKGMIGEKKSEEEHLREELEKYFKIGKDCRLIEDSTLYRVSADKKVAVEVLSIKNLEKKGRMRMIMRTLCRRCHMYF